MTSTTLLEAALCGKPTCSVQIGADTSDENLNLPGIAIIRSPGELRAALVDVLLGPSGPHAPLAVPVKRHAALRVVEILVEHIENSA